MAYEKELKEISKLRSSDGYNLDRRSKAYKDIEAKIKEISKEICRDYAQKLFESWGIFDQFGLDSFDKDVSNFTFSKGDEKFYFQISSLNGMQGKMEPPSGWFVNHFGSFNTQKLEDLSKEAVRAYVDKTISERNEDRNSQNIRQNLLKKFAEALKGKIDPESYASILKGYSEHVRWAYDEFGKRSPKDGYVRLEGYSETDSTLRVSGDIRCNLPVDRAIEMYRDLMALADKYCF